MPGPVKTPTKVLEMRGSWRADKRDGEPKPDATMPECPEWLLPDAVSKWDEITPQLHAMGVLGRCDGGALARYCQMWARWRAVEAGDGSATLSLKLAAALLRLEREFGLTPSARAGLAVPKDDDSENRGKRDKGRFFNGGSG